MEEWPTIATYRLRHQPAGSAMARRGEDRRQHQPQFRGRRRALGDGRRRCLRRRAERYRHAFIAGGAQPDRRVGIRIRLARRRLAPLTPVPPVRSQVSLLAVAKAAERNPELARAFVEDGHEIVSHGYRWLDYQTIPEEVERKHVRLGIETIERIAGVRPVGWMTGRPSANTRRLHLEFGGFLYDRDSLNDELPYWITIGATRHLVIPYSFETNDNRFDQNLGFSTGENFARYMIDCFEVMYEEGTEHPKLMSLALHDRLTGRPGRITGLVKFLDHITARDRVWICTGRQIAEHWRRAYPG